MFRNSKTLIQLVLMMLWLIAITAPSIIPFLDSDSKVLVSNLNEEEQQESPQGKKTAEAEKLFFNSLDTYIQISKQQSQRIVDFYVLGVSSHTPKIFLPPPERVV